MSDCFKFSLCNVLVIQIPGVKGLTSLLSEASVYCVCVFVLVIIVFVLVMKGLICSALV